MKLCTALKVTIMIWKDVKGYEGLYKVSNTGEVKTLERKVIRVNGRPLNHKERILSQTINRYGYKCVSLEKGGKRVSKTVHRLVMFAFGSKEVKETVNHKDGNKLNNNINNLEWATVKENIVHAEKNNLRKEKTVKIQKLKYGIVVAEYCSIKEAAQKNDVSTSSISNRMKRKCKPRNGIEYKRIK